MTDLTDFLLARIAGDEAVARVARRDDHLATRDRSFLSVEINNAGYAHVAATSGRLLAECEAKRRLIDGLVKFMEEDYAPWNEDFLRLLALPYADHEDYRQEWRP